MVPDGVAVTAIVRTNIKAWPWAVLGITGDTHWNDRLRQQQWCAANIDLGPSQLWDRDREGRWLFRHHEHAVWFQMVWG